MSTIETPDAGPLTVNDWAWLEQPEPGWTRVRMQKDEYSNNFVSGDRSGDRITVNYFRTATGDLAAKVIPGPKAQGPPGHAHGGSMMAILDEVMGGCVWLNGYKVLAAEVTTRLRNVMPLGSHVIGTGHIERIEGRKVYASGILRDEDGRVFAEAEGLFIQLTPDKLSRIREHLGYDWQAEFTASEGPGETVILSM